jgi:outer membrane immunogenic protein
LKKNLFATAASAAALAATPAAAQSAPAGVRVEAVFGIEGVLGYDKVEGLHDDDGDGGVLYGVGVGYDLPVTKNISLGVDAEATDSTQEEEGATTSIKAGRDLYAGGRVNFAISDKANLYLKGGYTKARFKAVDGDVSFTENAEGFRVGGGGQYAVSGKAYVGAEYRYSNYDGGIQRHQVALTGGTRF